jgi:hypothetical protein
MADGWAASVDVSVRLEKLATLPPAIEDRKKGNK